MKYRNTGLIEPKTETYCFVDKEVNFVYQFFCLMENFWYSDWNTDPYLIKSQDPFIRNL